MSEEKLKPVEADDIRMGDTIRIEYYKGNAFGDIALERTVQTEEYLEVLKDEIQEGFFKAVYLLDRPTTPLPTKPGLYYRNYHNEDVPHHDEYVVELGRGGIWWYPNAYRLTEEDLQELRESKVSLERLVFER